MCGGTLRWGERHEGLTVHYSLLVAANQRHHVIRGLDPKDVVDVDGQEDAVLIANILNLRTYLRRTLPKSFHQKARMRTDLDCLFMDI